MKRAAVISDCGSFRYTLQRDWGQSYRAKPMVFVMLNPSTADAEVDDPTIRRCIGFAEREGCDRIDVVNLFAFRSPSPGVMRGAVDPVGPDNNRILAETFGMAYINTAPVVAAWGTHGAFQNRDLKVYALAKANGVSLRCLGVTLEGHPKHPLYLPKDSPLTEWHRTVA